MNILIIAVIVGLLSAVAMALYGWASRPTKIDEEEAERIESETPEELAEEIKKEHHKTEEEEREEELELYSQK